MSDTVTEAPAQETTAAPAQETTAAPATNAAPATEALTTAQDGQPADWLANLPEELRADATLSRYKSIEDLARGHLETKRLATDKAGIKLPDGTDASIAAFVQAVRPESADVYEVAVPDGMPTEFADAFKGKAHELGLLPFQVKAIADWNNEQVAAMLGAGSEASAKELEAFKADYRGDFQKDLGKVQSMMVALGVEEEAVAELESKIGTKNLMNMMFNLQKQVGDFDSLIEVPTPTGFNVVAPEQAEAVLSQKSADPAWRQQAKVANSREAAEYKYLVDLAAKHRERQSRRTIGA